MENFKNIPYRILTKRKRKKKQNLRARTFNFIPYAPHTLNMNEKKRSLRVNESVSYVICRLMSFFAVKCSRDAIEPAVDLFSSNQLQAQLKNQRPRDKRHPKTVSQLSLIKSHRPSGSRLISRNGFMIISQFPLEFPASECSHCLHSSRKRLFYSPPRALRVE